ncbi:ferritin-like domain-containing protein [Streptomyces bohaiensis]|uniref:Ferritin-like domain-containing protein n=1 Tax=Streptomyces bohaiensis TaxID=1431344 RepID=A0ABX1C877_9ACTN|nr:ferritin-like domain-containing protein [Streptomyces bohaiensis]NJQ15351.1 ferritin-like domain-containing protein [Streptomyces bohaiensis]
MTGLWPAAGTGTDVGLLAAQAALAAEHATVYGYGVVGAWAGQEVRPQVRGLLEAHRGQRDELRQAVRELGGAPVAASAGYSLPFPVGDVATARDLAAELEERLAGAYADLVRASDGESRLGAARALRRSALRAAWWRGSGRALPGLAEHSASGARG